ncbi:MAG: metallophosphoesterase [Acholeplasmatales bacterium]|nr:metallophosphoesterase [Acholeplasmatales bacterium]
MKVAVISDIHSNYYSLESALKIIDKNNVETIIFNGDLVTDFPYPNKTMDMIMSLKDKYKIVIIKGNREEYIEEALGEINCLNSSINYTKVNLKDEYKEILKNSPYTYQIDDVLFTHANGKNTHELFYENSENTISYLKDSKHKLTVVGHSHFPFYKEYEGKMMINTGPLGHLNKEYEGGVFLILDTKTYEYEFKYALYDQLMCKMEFIESGLFDIGGVYIMSIMDMLDNNIPIASHVMKLGRRLMGDNPFDEKYFIEAYKYIKSVI